MDGELKVYYAGVMIGVFKKSREDKNAYLLSLPCVRLGAESLRQITNKLDELNRKESADAGH